MVGDLLISLFRLNDKVCGQFIDATDEVDSLSLSRGIDRMNRDCSQSNRVKDNACKTQSRPNSSIENSCLTEAHSDTEKPQANLMTTLFR